MTRTTAPMPLAQQHIAELRRTLARSAGAIEQTTAAWGAHLAGVLPDGQRLLAAGNGGSAAQAQHLTAELVGRYRDDRTPLAAVALHAETSTMTAVANDYGWDDVFARQVVAHGRRGDVLFLLSTSGTSRNMLRAAEAGRRAGLTVWAMTGPRQNPLAELSHEALCIDSPTTATVQEAHLVAVHLVCAALDVALGVCPAAPSEPLALSESLALAEATR